MVGFDIVWKGYEENDEVIDNIIQPYIPPAKEKEKSKEIKFEKNYREGSNSNSGNR